MEQIIENIYELIKDYRADENNPDVQITIDRIRIWIEQFEEILRIPLLTELLNIMNKRFYDKIKIKNFLLEVINRLTRDLNFQTPQEFLKNSIFLDLQAEGKSQKIMLNLLNELIIENYEMGISDCASESKGYSIYVDDILCTGSTLFFDIRDWSSGIFSDGKTNLQAIEDNSITLIFAFVFIHKKNYHKKVAEIRHKLSEAISTKHKMYSLETIENEIDSQSKIDLLLPLEFGQSEQIISYKNQIIGEVNIHTQRYNRTSPEEFYRPVGFPSTEEFFTSPANRKIVEDAILNKGIEILNRVQSRIANMRALGYSLPSVKNFGFGALCFTWRNVPNNAPLVFWYAGGGFTPLFKVHRGNVVTVIPDFLRIPS